MLKKKTYPVLPSPGINQLRIFNGVPDCDYTIQTNMTDLPEITLKGIDYWVDKNIKMEHEKLTTRYLVEPIIEGCPKFPEGIYTFNDTTAYSVFLQNKIQEQPIYVYEERIDKSKHANSIVTNLANIEKNRKIIWRLSKSGAIEWNESANNRTTKEFKPDTYEVLVDNVKVHEQKLRHGGVYVLIIGSNDNGDFTTKMIEVTEPNSISILWLIPQYFVMTLGEVMFSVTGLEFSYSQAPLTMKSVLQACWLLTVAFGNIIVVVVAELKFFKSQANEFFLFAGLMFVDMILFMWMAYRYNPNNPMPGSAVPKEIEEQPRSESSSNFTKHQQTQQQQQRLPKYSKRQAD